MQEQVAAQQAHASSEGEKQTAPGKAMAIGLVLALLAIALSTESITMINVVRAKVFPYALPQLYGLYPTNLTQLEHLAGIFRWLICFGGGLYAGRTSARLAPGFEIITGVAVFLGCMVAYGAAVSNPPIYMTLYAALCAPVFPLFLCAGIWWGRRENREGRPVAPKVNRARPVLAFACAAFSLWLLPMLILHAYAHITTDTHDQMWFADPAFYEARNAFGHINMIVVECATAILGGYLCARLARGNLIVVAPVLLVVLGYPVLIADLDPVRGLYLRGENLHLGLLFLGMFAGWVHMRFKKRPAAV